MNGGEGLVIAFLPLSVFVLQLLRDLVPIDFPWSDFVCSNVLIRKRQIRSVNAVHHPSMPVQRLQ